jgi:hypothetical protein
MVESLVTATTGFFNGTVTANSFVGALTGSVTGAATQLNATANTNAFEYIVGVAGSGSAQNAVVATTNPVGFNASTGNVGIGTTSLVAKLTVVGGTSNASDLATAYSTAALNITPKSSSGYSLAFGSGPNDRPYIQMSAAGTAPNDIMLQPYGGYVGIGTTVNNVYDQVAAQRPLVVQSSATSTTLNGSSAAITIVNGDTTTNNTAQLNFAAITGASTNQYSSAIISAIFGARTNAQYPTGQLVFSVSSTLNSAPTEKMRITANGGIAFSGSTNYGTAGQVLQSNGDAAPTWVAPTGAVGSSTNQVFFLNDQTVTGSYSIPSGKNAGTFGPITVNSGVTVTVPSGSVWTIV